MPMSLSPWVATCVFGLGLVVGSFLNVVIARVPAGESIVSPRSRCPRCGHPLAWFENIPLLSWLVLRARCRACRATISARYPAVELLTGFLFLGCWLRFGMSWGLLRGLLLVGFLVPLTFIDLEHWLLPFELTLPGLALGVLSAIPLGWDALRDAAGGAAAAFLFFWGLEVAAPFLVGVVRWVLALVRWAVHLGRRVLGNQGLAAQEFPKVSVPKEALGGGDKWLLALLGAFLGWQPLFGLLLLSSVQGMVVSVGLLLAHGRAAPPPVPVADAAAGPESDDFESGPTHLPFGPWLALAGLELMLLGPVLEQFLPAPLARMLTGGLGA